MEELSEGQTPDLTNRCSAGPRVRLGLGLAACRLFPTGAEDSNLDLSIHIKGSVAAKPSCDARLSKVTPKLELDSGLW